MNCRNLPLLCEGGLLHNDCINGNDIHPTGEPHQGHNEKSNTIYRLFRLTQRHHHYLQSQWYGACGSQRRFIPVWNQSKEPSKGTFLYVKQLSITAKHRRCTHSCPNHQSSNVILRRSQARSSLYINCRGSIPELQALQEIGHPQPPTPVHTDNTTALGVSTNTIHPKLKKGMDIRFHWIRCRKVQMQFRHLWGPGRDNLGDYTTKHHPCIHNITVISMILTPLGKIKKSRARMAKTKFQTRNMSVARVC